MATNFKTLISSYIGSFADKVSLDNWLTAGARTIMQMLPDEKLKRYAGEVSVTSGGLDIRSYRIFMVHKAGYYSNEYPASFKAMLQNVDSMYYATSTSPAHVYDNQKLYVFPNGGVILAVTYPSVGNTDDTITNFPIELMQAVILYASIQAQMQKINTNVINLDALTPTIPSAPSVISAPSFVYSDITVQSITPTIIDALPSAPA